MTKTANESLQSNQFINEKFEEYKSVNEEVLMKLKEITNQNKELLAKNKMLEDQLKIESEERKKMEEHLYTVLNPIQYEKNYLNLEIHGKTEEMNENCHKIVIKLSNKLFQQ